MTVYYATGHRPDKLGGYTDEVREELEDFATEILSSLQKGDAVIVGMALGWDQAVAVAAIRLGIKLIAAVPHIGHGSNWPPESRKHHQWILSKADEVHHAEVPYSREAMLERNIWMINKGSVCLALWDGSNGGTGHCVKHSKKKQVINLWSRWIRFKEKKGMNDGKAGE